MACIPASIARACLPAGPSRCIADCVSPAPNGFENLDLVRVCEDGGFARLADQERVHRAADLRDETKIGADILADLDRDRDRDGRVIGVDRGLLLTAVVEHVKMALFESEHEAVIIGEDERRSGDQAHGNADGRSLGPGEAREYHQEKDAHGRILSRRGDLAAARPLRRHNYSGRDDHTPRSLPFLLALVLCAVPARAQSWESVRGLQPGDRVKVQETGGKEHKGVVADRDPGSDFARRQANAGLARPRPREAGSDSQRIAARRNIAIGAAIGVAPGSTVRSRRSELTCGTR